jgi:hypothetical protein
LNLFLGTARTHRKLKTILAELHDAFDPRSERRDSPQTATYNQQRYGDRFLLITHGR